MSELYHYGVLGMKWGVRKRDTIQRDIDSFKPYEKTGIKNKKGKTIMTSKQVRDSIGGLKKVQADISKRERLEKARQNYRNEQKRLIRSGGFGREAIARYSANKGRAERAELNYIDEKIKYKTRKKSGSKLDKALKRQYRRELKKTGLHGSAYDVSKGNRSTRLYNHMVESKGKEFADSVEKSLEKQLVGEIIGGTAVSLGLAAASIYLQHKY